MIYGTERVIKSVDHPLWNEYSPEQIQMLKLIGKEKQITSARLAVLQAVNKSAISSRIKKLLQKEVIQVVQTTDRREKLLELTEKGQEIRMELDQVLTDYIEKLMAENIADEEIDQFLTIFRKLKTILKMDGV